ncbi:helix-turn-helix domain-containing protein [Nocardioides sp. SR21]|uniref:helix-turn-helix domain-containing protein n=1 Tax=Nocardioides sp. SR21 TaxID=2919501 RepID=UPI001FAA67F7|nr:helix-turn-helix domain-containing protein [Nocardioides sp. SR21]
MTDATTPPHPKVLELVQAGTRLQWLKTEQVRQEREVGELVRATADQVTPTQAARMTGLSRPTIYKMLRGDA